MKKVCIIAQIKLYFMISIQILIKRKNEKSSAWPELNDTNSLMGDITGVCILENGTVNGQPVLCFRIETPRGPVLAQTTENIYRAVTSALDGAKYNWFNNPISNDAV